jgi:microcystin-dependent protein
VALPPFDNQIPTGNTPPPGFRYYQFRIAAADWVVKAVMGQLIALNTPGAFFQVGTATPDDAAELLTRVYESVKQVYPIGSIIAYGAGLPATTDILACDGASYLRADYPDLFAAIGTIWGAADGSHFNVPDLRGRAIVDVGQGPGLSNRVAGQTFGEETHTLSNAEMPAHSHNVNNQNTFATLSPPVGLIPAPEVSILAITGNTGGGASHNNMQPSGVCTFGIVAR